MAGYSRKRRGGGCTGSKATCAKGNNKKFSQENPMRTVGKPVNAPKEPEDEELNFEAYLAKYEKESAESQKTLAELQAKLAPLIKQSEATQAVLARPIGGISDEEVQAELNKIMAAQGTSGGRRRRKSMKAGGICGSKGCVANTPATPNATATVINPMTQIGNQITRLREELQTYKKEIESNPANPLTPGKKKTFNASKGMLKNFYTIRGTILFNEMKLLEKGSEKYNKYLRILQINEQVKGQIDVDFPSYPVSGGRRKTYKRKSRR